MKNKTYFKNKLGEIFILNEMNIANGMSDGLTILTDEEVEEFLNPVLTEEEILRQKLAEADTYLKSTDFYYARFSEIDEPVPEAIATKRIESRNFIRENEDKVTK